MKLLFKPFFLLASFILLVVLSVVLFLCVDSQAFKSYAFWVCYGVSFPLVLLISAFLVIYTNKCNVIIKDESAEYALTRNKGIVYSFNVLVVLQGFVLMLVKGIKNNILLSIELIIAAVYVITILYIVCVSCKKENTTN